MTPPDLAVRAIRAQDTRTLRHAILHPEDPPDFSAYPSDLEAHTGHFGAFAGNLHVGVASVCLEAMPPGGTAPAWRVRDMGVLNEFRRTGCGSALLEACLSYVTTHNGAIIWCYARPTAVSFYLAHCFVAHGDTMHLAGFGPRVIMSRPVDFA